MDGVVRVAKVTLTQEERQRMERPSKETTVIMKNVLDSFFIVPSSLKPAAALRAMTAKSFISCPCPLIMHLILMPVQRIQR